VFSSRRPIHVIIAPAEQVGTQRFPLTLLVHFCTKAVEARRQLKLTIETQNGESRKAEILSIKHRNSALTF
jgi:hypothetical protein